MDREILTIYSNNSKSKTRKMNKKNSLIRREYRKTGNKIEILA